MEEKKCYLYGEEIKLVICGAEEGWGRIACNVYDDLMECLKVYADEHFNKILQYEVDNDSNEVTIRMLSGSEDVVNDVARIIEGQSGAKGKRYKLQIRSPLPSENKI